MHLSRVAGILVLDVIDGVARKVVHRLAVVIVILHIDGLVPLRQHTERRSIRLQRVHTSSDNELVFGVVTVVARHR